MVVLMITPMQVLTGMMMLIALITAYTRGEIVKENEIMAEISIYKGKNGLSIILNNMRITYPKIYGVLTPIQTWDIDYSDLFDAIPIDIIKYYVDKKLGNVAKETDAE